MTWGNRWPKKQKFGNKKVQEFGHWFDSKLEAAVFGELKLREKAGEIAELRHHPGTVFLSAARVQYRPDFRWVNVATGKVEYGEAKGMPTPMFALKKRLWKTYGPGPLVLYQGSARSFRITETIIPKVEAA